MILRNLKVFKVKNRMKKGDTVVVDGQWWDIVEVRRGGDFTLDDGSFDNVLAYYYDIKDKVWCIKQDFC